MTPQGGIPGTPLSSETVPNQGGGDGRDDRDRKHDEVERRASANSLGIANRRRVRRIGNEGQQTDADEADRRKGQADTANAQATEAAEGERTGELRRARRA